MKRGSIVLLVCVIVMACSETRPSALLDLYQPIDTAVLNQAFENFKEKTLTQRRFTHAAIEPLILSLDENAAFSVSELGKSVQQRSIYQIDYGTGDKKV